MSVPGAFVPGIFLPFFKNVRAFHPKNEKAYKSSLFALYDKEILKCRYAAGFTDLIKRFLLTETGLRLCPVRQKAGRGEKSRCRGAKKQFCLNKNGESVRVRQRRRGEIPSPV